MTRRPPATAVLFDLDGVLVDSSTVIPQCINAALRAQGLPERSLAELQRLIGPPLAAGFAELTGRPVDSRLVRACVDSYRNRYAEASLRDTVVTPGIVAALTALSDRRRLGVATSKPLAFAAPLLEALDLRRFFDVIAGPRLGLQVEDKSVTIGRALSALRPVKAVMVGDRRSDIVGARGNRLPAIGVAWGYGTADELAEAAAVVQEPAELHAAVEAVLTAA